ncbi:MAG: hypothetical protein Q8Q89_04555 [bacterium]|nr:hypothetical protein [bacterium]
MGKKLRRIAGSPIFLVVVIIVGIVNNYFYQFNYHRNQLHFYIVAGDDQLARAELNNVKYYDGLARKWKMGWFADRYLLNNEKIALYNGAYDYLIGAYQKVANSSTLEESNDYRADHMIGSAKVRLLQAKYREEKDPAVKKKLMAALVMQMLEDVSPYFKKAVELSPDFKFPDPNFNDRLNYDMTSDEDAAQRVIEAKQPDIKFILGIPEELPGDEPGNKKGPVEGRRLNEETQPGAGGDPKKKG